MLMKSYRARDLYEVDHLLKKGATHNICLLILCCSVLWESQQNRITSCDRKWFSLAFNFQKCEFLWIQQYSMCVCCTSHTKPMTSYAIKWECVHAEVYIWCMIHCLLSTWPQGWTLTPSHLDCPLKAPRVPDRSFQWMSAFFRWLTTIWHL